MVTFELKIGETVLSEVGLEEVLDYVSPYHLEEYENEEFQREEELLRIAEEDDRRFKEERDARRKEKAKNKGKVIMSETSSDDVEGQVEVEVNTGKHGRARPSYKPLFMKFKQRRQRRKRDPKTGELISRSDEDEAMDFEQQESSSDDKFESKPEIGPVSLDNLPKRRRRKRDPVTGELLPLAPLASTLNEFAPSRSVTVERQLQMNDSDALEKQKRPRRRRHPVTKELMPLGWRYNPDEEEQNSTIKVSQMQRLSISHESEPKRRRLDRSAASNERSESPRMATQSTNKGQRASIAPLSAFKRGDVISLPGSDTDDTTSDSIDVKPAAPKPKLLRRGVGGAPVVQNAMESQSPSKSPPASQPIVQTLPVRTSPQQPLSTRMSLVSSNSSIIPLQVDDAESTSSDDDDGNDEISTAMPAPTSVTSIMNPSAAADESSSSEESEEEDLPEDEFFVEDILDHALSNPLTHPDKLGKEPVMLYKVKWEGWPGTTWEPETSFGDLGVVREYQQKVGMKIDEPGS